MHQRLSDKKSEWEGTDCRQKHVPGVQAGCWGTGKAPGGLFWMEGHRLLCTCQSH